MHVQDAKDDMDDFEPDPNSIGLAVHDEDEDDEDDEGGAQNANGTKNYMHACFWHCVHIC
jgi:hypothetical protein